MKHSEQLMELMQQNTELTKMTQDLSKRIETLTAEIYGQVVAKEDNRSL